jgi:hypothetical protein
MEDVGTFYGHLVYILCVHLVYFPRFGTLRQEKSGNPAAEFGASLIELTRPYVVQSNLIEGVALE